MEAGGGEPQLSATVGARRDEGHDEFAERVS